VGRVDVQGLEALLEQLHQLGVLRGFARRPLGMWHLALGNGEVLRPDTKETAMWAMGAMAGVGATAEELLPKIHQQQQEIAKYTQDEVETALRNSSRVSSSRVDGCSLRGRLPASEVAPPASHGRAPRVRRRRRLTAQHDGPRLRWVGRSTCQQMWTDCGPSLAVGRSQRNPGVRDRWWGGTGEPTSGPRRQLRPADSAVTHQRAGRYTDAAMILASENRHRTFRTPDRIASSSPARYESGDHALGHVTGIAILGRVAPGQLEQ
jgi:hypothetical protein